MALHQRSAQRRSRRCSEMEVEIGRGGGNEDDKKPKPDAIVWVCQLRIQKSCPGDDCRC
jgi:hypothetical protein